MGANDGFNSDPLGIGRVLVLDPNGPGVIGEDPRFSDRPNFEYTPGEKIPQPPKDVR